MVQLLCILQYFSLGFEQIPMYNTHSWLWAIAHFPYLMTQDLLHQVQASLCWCSWPHSNAYSKVAFLMSTTLSSPPIVMAFTHAHCWARVILLGRPPIEGSTWGTHFPQILENVVCKIPNNFDTPCVLCPCCNKGIAFNFFSFDNSLTDKEAFIIVR